MGSGWRNELEAWLSPFAAALRDKTLHRMCPVYIGGLIGPGGRRNVQPMAAREGQVSYDRPHHFVGCRAWSEAPLEAALLGFLFQGLMVRSFRWNARGRMGQVRHRSSTTPHAVRAAIQ